jgi:hypothetical protein
MAVGRPGCPTRDAEKRRPKEAELTLISIDVAIPHRTMLLRSETERCYYEVGVSSSSFLARSR